MSIEPRVSVIVPVRDDVAGCRALVGRLAAQTLRAEAFEIVIGSDGPANAGVRELAASDGRIRVIDGPRATSYAARQRAAAAARGAVLAFTDTDCLPDPAWLEAGLAALAAADVVAGEVTYIAPDAPTVWSRLSVDLFLDQARNVRRGAAVTANLFVGARAFARWGGFDVHLASGADFEFVQRAVAAGARLAYAPRAVVRHPTIDRPRALFRKVWRTNWWSAARRRRSGAPVRRSAVGLLPIIGGLWMRRDTLRPAFGLERGRLAAAGIATTRWQHAVAALALHGLVVPTANAARLFGWFTSRRAAAPAAAVQAPRSGSSSSAR